MEVRRPTPSRQTGMQVGLFLLIVFSDIRLAAVAGESLPRLRSTCETEPKKHLDSG